MKAAVTVPSKPLTLDLMETSDLFSEGLAKRVLQKNEWIKRCEKLLDSQSRFCSFLAQDLSKEATDLARNGT